MARGVNGTDALETITAAATVIASAEARGGGARGSLQRRWGSCFNILWCFGLNKSKRIGPAIILPDDIFTNPNSLSSQNASQHHSIVLPFVAPPSSPASFLPSETPSVAQSPTAMLSWINVSVGMFSPGGPSSIFAIGPYANETQLVSPPVFSSFPTEPSTAPYTPPPESAHLTTPSSPEVPFAQFLEPTPPNCQRYHLSQYEFQHYHLQPGSPVSHLISPCSGISSSGTSSPFRDSKVNAVALRDLKFEKIVPQEWCGLNRKTSDAASGLERYEATADQEPVEDAEKEGKQTVLSKNKTDRHPEQSNNSSEEEHQNQKKRTATLESSKEFIFDSVDGDESQDCSSVWWTNEALVAEEGSRKNWPFFTGVS